MRCTLGCLVEGTNSTLAAQSGEAPIWSLPRQRNGRKRVSMLVVVWAGKSVHLRRKTVHRVTSEFSPPAISARLRQWSNVLSSMQGFQGFEVINVLLVTQAAPIHRRTVGPCLATGMSLMTVLKGLYPMTRHRRMKTFTATLLGRLRERKDLRRPVQDDPNHRQHQRVTFRRTGNLTRKLGRGISNRIRNLQ